MLPDARSLCSSNAVFTNYNNLKKKIIWKKLFEKLSGYIGNFENNIIHLLQYPLIQTFNLELKREEIATTWTKILAIETRFWTLNMSTYLLTFQINLFKKVHIVYHM